MKFRGVAWSICLSPTLFWLTACGNNITTSSPPPPAQVDVYTAGFEIAAISRKPFIGKTTFSTFSIAASTGHVP
jgi:hypothetical protein